MSRSSWFVITPIVAILALATIFSQRWDSDKPRIGLAVANLQADFFNQIKQSVTKEAAKQGVQVVVADARGDAATQVNQIEDFVTKQVDAIIYIPAGATAAGVPVKNARKAGIPIIAVDRHPAPATYIRRGAAPPGVPVKPARKAGIPIIAVDRTPPDAPADTFIASDSV